MGIKIKRKSKKNKRAVSLMLSYVLLIVISMALAIGVYAWWKFMAKGIEEIKKCPEDVKLIIQDYKFLEGKIVQLDIKNKGLFNADGYAIRGTNNKSQESWFKLIDVMGMGAGGREGIYLFLDPLQPNKIDQHSFSYEGLDKLEKIEIEPIRIIEKKIILCENAVISQETNFCGDGICNTKIGENCKNCPTDCGACSFNPMTIPSMVSWWRFDEGIGTTAYDSKGSNDGAFINNPEWVDGVNGKALYFNGSNGTSANKIEVPDSLSLAIVDEITISMWVKVASQDKNWTDFFRKSSDRIELGRPNIGRELFAFGILAINGNFWNYNEWFYLTYTSTKIPSNYSALYINGEYVNNITTYTPLPLKPGNLSIGTAHSTDTFNGTIDEVMIFNESLDETTIQNIYCNQRFC